MEYLKIKGARTHNLKNISVDLPRNKLIVITGLSGSGKSSLAFDTLYAEGQRRYVESLSAYARQFLDRMNKPDVDLIEGLSPAIAIEQKSTSHNPRSTVGTVTEIHDYLRLLYARAGDPYCPDHQIKLEAKTISQMVDQILNLPTDTKLMILAPVINDRKGSHADLIDELRAQGFIRARVDGNVYEIDDIPPLEKNIKHQIDVVIDRIKVSTEIKQRITESLETGLKIADNKIITHNMETKEDVLFSAKFSCPHCDYGIPELEPRLFSFNNPIPQTLFYSKTLSRKPFFNQKPYPANSFSSTIETTRIAAAHIIDCEITNFLFMCFFARNYSTVTDLAKFLG